MSPVAEPIHKPTTVRSSVVPESGSLFVHTLLLSQHAVGIFRRICAPTLLKLPYDQRTEREGMEQRRGYLDEIS